MMIEELQARVIVQRRGKIQKVMDIENKDDRLRDNIGDG
jgi:hypothetical protein